METQPDTVLPVIRDVLAKAPGTTAVDAFRAQYRLQALKQVCDAVMSKLDFVLTPSFPRPVTLAELEADPIGPNSLLGYYTNFMNLLDYAAVAVPAGFMANRLQSIRHESSRNSYRSIVQKIHEVGVIPQQGVGTNRVRLQFSQRNGPGKAWRQDEVQLAHDGIADLLERLKPVLCAKCVDGGRAGCFGEYVANHG